MTLGIVLAAGKGRRMFSDLPKVAHPVLGRPMILRVLETASSCGFDRLVTVIGHGRQLLEPLLAAGGYEWVVQEPQLGTAHAVGCAVGAFDADEYCVLLGDVPLLRGETIRRLLSGRRKAGAAATVLTGFPPDPAGYGRVVRSSGDRIERIVEDRDAGPGDLSLREVNTGLMCFDGQALRNLLGRIGRGNAQNEYYLTDAVGLAAGDGLVCTAVTADEWGEVAGINDQYQLAEASRTLCARVVESMMRSGVLFTDPVSVWVEDTVSVGRGTTVGRMVRLSGGASIGEGCLLGDGCIVSDASIPPGTELPPYAVRCGR
ncbi:bifunctional N-acetylglucosamine-1-phosphate uridyltransferase/glucosamine-1-phosphate acetyltransferase [Candidatus Fermentibacteria bacterium]|nr:bifunctional N-acetylglucosamine-1-phosphate uridyltransferase/glucosamine-1-phosphate acetyltransferase [Candidatus Fermentibacteria bacterium]